MKKINFIFILSILSFLLLFLATSRITYAQTNDKEIGIVYPEEGGTLSGIVTIRWYMATELDPHIVYNIILFSNKCDSTDREYVGEIEHGIVDANINNSQDFYNSTWDTRSNLRNSLDVENGNYCLAIDYFSDVNNSMGLQTQVNITINNDNNTPPLITNTERNFTIKTGEGFNLKVEAKDSENDTLQYKLIEAPDFLTINESTGELSNKSSIVNTGTYRVVVEVSDQNQATDKTVFCVNVVDALSDITEGTNAILIPNKNVVYIGGNYVEWTISSAKDLTSISLYYSSKLTTWGKFAQMSIDDTKVNFDSTTLPKGEYFVLAVLNNSSGPVYSFLSDEFYIAKAIQYNQKIISSIYDVVPSEDSQGNKNLNSITGKYNLTSDIEDGKLQLVVLLDDTDITSQCNFLVSEFECVLQEPLNDGSHKILIKVVKEGKLETVKQWFFSVGAGITITPTTTGSGTVITKNNKDTVKIFGGEISKGALIFAVTLICLGLLIVLIPWYLFSIWIRGNKKSDGSNGGYKTDFPTFTPIVPGNQPAPQFNPEPQYQIGTQSITDDVYMQTPDVQMEEQITSPVFQEVEEPSLPTSYTDNDIPDWLRDTTSSTPVGSQGQKYNTPEPIKGTEPYGYQEYGKAGQDY